MKEQFTRFKELLLLDGLNLSNVICLVSTLLFGLVGFSVWLIGLLVSKHIRK